MADAAQVVNQKADPYRGMGEITIEIGDDRNRRFLWAPTKQELRGRWSRVNLKPDEATDELSRLPDIPGVHVTVDTRAMVLKITDPLNEPRNAELSRQLSALLKELFRSNNGPEKDKVYNKATPTQVKTWLYWMRRMVDGAPEEFVKGRRVAGPYAKVVVGKLPELEDIAALPGKTAVENYNASARATKFIEDRKPDDVQPS